MIVFPPLNKSVNLKFIYVLYFRKLGIYWYHNLVQRQQSRQNLNFSLFFTRSSIIYNFGFNLFFLEESKEEAVSLTDMFDFSLFKSHTFVMFVTGHLLFNIVYAVPFTYLPIKGEEAGFSEQSSALFITVLGAGSSISRILFGWMSGKFPLIRKKAFLVVVLTVTLSLLPVSFTRSYSIIMVCSTIFGACAGNVHIQ